MTDMVILLFSDHTWFACVNNEKDISNFFLNHFWRVPLADKYKDVTILDLENNKRTTKRKEDFLKNY